MTDRQRLADRILELQAETYAVDELLRELPADGRDAARQTLIERRDQANALLSELHQQLARPKEP
jgi:hypothetical protein